MSDLIERWDRFTYDDQHRERERWVRAVLSSLADAGTYGLADDRLTRAERDLLLGIEYRLRGRIGETQTDGTSLTPLGDTLIRRAAAEIAGDAS